MLDLAGDLLESLAFVIKLLVTSFLVAIARFLLGIWGLLE